MHRKPERYNRSRSANLIPIFEEVPYTLGMTLKEGGILVARGLAIYFLATSLALALATVESLPFFAAGPDWRVTESYFAEAALYFLMAGVLWRRAEKFAPDVPSRESGAPIDQSGLLKVFIAAIAVWWIVKYADLLLDQAETAIHGDWVPIYSIGLARDLLVITVAALTIRWCTKGISLTRMNSYPRSEPPEGDQG